MIIDNKDRKRRKAMEDKNRKKRESHNGIQKRTHLRLKHASKYGAHVPC